MDRPQQVSLNGFKCNKLVLNPPAPQGCVLSPILSSVYNNNISRSPGPVGSPDSHSGSGSIPANREQHWENSLELNILV